MTTVTIWMMILIIQRWKTGETRTSPVTGIVQTGKKLGLGDINGLFASLNERGQMTKGDLPSASKFFSEALALLHKLLIRWLAQH